MCETIAVPSGEWKLSTNWVGHCQGLPHITGGMIARRGNKCLLWDGTTVHEICSANFIGHYEER